MGSDFNNWPYRATFHIDHTKVSADYGAFALPIRWMGSAGALPSAILQTGNAQAAKSDGGDLRFTDQYGNEIPFDIVEFTQAAAVADARAEIWVQLPSLSTTADTTFYMFWGNSAASGYASSDPFGRYNAFTGWNMVYHGNDTGSGNMNNSTAATWGMTNSGTTVIDGKIGKARSFNGSSNYMYISGGLASGTPDFSNYISIMGWAYWNAWTSGAPVVDFGNGAAQDNFKVYNYNNLAVSDILEDFINNTTHHYKGDSPGWKDLTTWKHFIITWDNTTDLIYCYINGVLQGTTLSAPDWLRNAVRQYCNLGKSNDASPIYFNGYLDEVRIGNAVATATYVSIAYNAQNAPETFVIFDATASKPIFPSGWKYKCPLTQDHTKCGTGTQSNFTTPFVWTGSQATSNLPQVMFDADGGQSAKSDGSDLRFTSDAAGTTQLPFQIVNFTTNNNPANALAEIWVKVPSVNSSTDTVIYVWWGKSDAIAYLPGEAYGQYAVWNNSNEVVYHLQTYTTPIVDSTAYMRHGTVLNSASQQNGKIGKAMQFNYTAPYPSIAAPYSVLNGTIVPAGSNAKITISFWNYGGTSQPSQNSNIGAVSAAGRELNAHVPWTDQNIYWDCAGGASYDRISVLDNDSSHWKGAWNFWTFTKDVAAGTMRIYRNGSQIQSGTGKTKTFSTITDFEIGIYPGGLTPYDGSIDEFRVDSVERSAAWVLTDYNSQNSPQTFWGVGTVIVISQVGIVISGVWKTVSAIYIVISGVWKNINSQKMVMSNAWKDC